MNRLATAIFVLIFTLPSWSAESNPNGVVAHEWGLWQMNSDNSIVTVPGEIETLPPHVRRFPLKPAEIPIAIDDMDMDHMLVKKPIVWFYGKKGQRLTYSLYKTPGRKLVAAYPAPSGGEAFPIKRRRASKKSIQRNVADWSIELLGPATIGYPGVKAGHWYKKLRINGPATISVNNQNENFLFYECTTPNPAPFQREKTNPNIVRFPKGSPFVLTVDVSPKGAHFYTRPVAVGETIDLEASDFVTAHTLGLPAGADDARTQLIEYLRRTGLNPAEADAFVNVWEEEIFTAPGRRMLVFLSKEDYEKLVPAGIYPKPKEWVRVGAVLVNLVEQPKEKPATEPTTADVYRELKETRAELADLKKQLRATNEKLDQLLLKSIMIVEKAGVQKGGPVAPPIQAILLRDDAKKPAVKVKSKPDAGDKKNPPSDF